MMGKANFCVQIYDTKNKKVVETLAFGPSLEAVKKFIAKSDFSLKENQVFSVYDESWDDQVVAWGHPDGTWELFDPNDQSY